MSNQALAFWSLFGFVGICTFIWQVLWPAIYPEKTDEQSPPA